MKTPDAYYPPPNPPSTSDLIPVIKTNKDGSSDDFVKKEYFVNEIFCQ